jgi:hypothetical protein
MRKINVLITSACTIGLAGLALAADTPAPRINAAEAKNHIGETAMVCGKVVSNKVLKYGLAGHGKPITFDLDQPEPNPVFYFVTFGSDPEGKDAIAAYDGKNVCVTGKINQTSGHAFIMAADREQIKVEAK